MKKVALLIIATNKYTCFLEDLVESSEKHFLKDQDVTFCIFTDKPSEVNHIFGGKPYNEKIQVYHVHHEPWPASTLNRFHFFNQYRGYIRNFDYYFYIDADTKITADINSEKVLSNRTVTLHCGFCRTDGKRADYERNVVSHAYVKPTEGTHYFGGGFWGFSKLWFWNLVDWAIYAINQDDRNNAKAEWFDEAYLNRYMIDNKPEKILTPSYHYPETNPYVKHWPEHYPCIILLLDKDHKELQV